MQIHTTLSSLRALRPQLSTIALVPTMGNLHQGHLSLIKQAQAQASTVIVSLFVNRLQFGPSEDFDSYPRTLDEDCKKLRSLGLEHVFAPEEALIYPEEQNYYVEPAPAQASILEGEFRPGHFRGVATVVLKLLNFIQPDIVLFGKKDYQQLMVLSNMVRQLGLPLKVLQAETVRAEDGLALSSRNRYLSAQQRSEAPRLYRKLLQIRDAVRSGAANVVELEQLAIKELRAHGWKPDYITVRRRLDLQPPSQNTETLVVLAAAHLGQTRLIDNLEI